MRHYVYHKFGDSVGSISLTYRTESHSFIVIATV